jgi:hypothetical protein
LFEDVGVVAADENSEQVSDQTRGSGKGKDFTGKSSQAVAERSPEAFGVVGLNRLLSLLPVAIRSEKLEQGCQQ